MKAKKQRRALLMSALSLLLCVSMLVGATFAWFTDEVTSGQNTIAAGNLDVELYYTPSADVAANPDSNAWIKVDSNTDVFGYDNWEPGFTKVVYFKIVNEGSLALKYKLAADVYSEKSGTNKAGSEFQLSDYLYTAVVPVGSTRDQILAMNGTKLNANFAMGKGNLVAKANENGTDKATAVVGLAIWMPTAVENTANHNGTAPEITFGINLLATQYTSEQDSFDANYDQDARYPAISLPGTLPETGNTAPVEEMLLKTMDGVSTQLPADLVEDIGGKYTNARQLHLTHTEPIFDTAAKTVSFGNIDIVDENGNVVELEAMNNTVPITVVVPVGDTFAVGDTVIIYHDGEAVASAVVDADKNVTYTVLHFCEVVVSAGDGQVDTALELSVALAKGGTITLANDITVAAPIEIPAGVEVTLDLNGKTINTAYAEGSTTNHVYAFTNNGTLLLKNGTVNARGIFNYGNMTIENATINAIDGNGGYAIRNYSGSTLTMNSGTIATTLEDDHLSDAGGYDATTLRVDAGSSAVINGGTIENICDFTSAIENYGTVEVNDAEITAIHTAVYNKGTMTFNGGSVSCGMDGTTRHTIYDLGGKIVINGGTFINTATDQNATGASVINGNVEVNGGTFSGRIENYYGTPVIKGGTFSADPSAYLASVCVATESNGKWVVAISDLQTVINNANAGDTIVLNGDVTATSVIMIDKDIVIEGNGYKVSSTATRVFRVITSDVEVTLNNVNMVSNAVRVSSNDIRGISVDGDLTNISLTMNDCSVDFTDASAHDWSYAVNVVGGTGYTVIVNGGVYEGANAINIRGAGQTVVVKNATLTSLYQPSPYENMYGACIYVVQNASSSLEAVGNTFNGGNAVAINAGYTPVVESDNVDNTTRA